MWHLRFSRFLTSRSNVVRRLFKLVLLAIIAAFLVIQIEVHLLTNQNVPPGDKVPSGFDGDTLSPVPPANRYPPEVPFANAAELSVAEISAAIGSRAAGVNQSAFHEGLRSVGMPSLEQIRRIIDDDNLNALMLNEKKFGYVNASNVNEMINTVIVVQVHNRTNYLAKLIQSFKMATHVEKTLVIFSHDFYSPEINKLIRDIDFCRVLQIFYPFSIQLHPERFPGQDPRDCPPKMTKNDAATNKCLNWEHPDKYGHYRVAKISQLKHHWWWKMNFVFDGVYRLRNYSGWMLLLEEDHYVSPDVFHVLDHVVQNKDTLCQECRVISLGVYLKHYKTYADDLSKLSIYPWFSSKHNMGMVINRQTWNSWKTCANKFCVYDDYNWDWSLMHVNLKCLKPGPMQVLYTKAPRVFHVGDCGVHHKGKACTADASSNKVNEILEGVKRKLFPEKMVVADRSKRTLKAPKENGGWGDVRDHQLCMNHTLNSSAER